MADEENEMEEIEDEASSDSENDASFESPQKKKKKICFTKQDNLVIRKGCMKFLLSNRSITMESVKELFKGSVELKKLMETFGLQTLITKLRSERRRLKNRK